MSEKDNMLGALDSVIFREPPDGFDENCFGAIVGTFGGYRDFLTVAQLFRNAANCLIDAHKNNYYEYKLDNASFSFCYDGDWSKGEYWIGYYNLKNDFNWFFDGLEKAYRLVSKNQGKQTGVKQ